MHAPKALATAAALLLLPAGSASLAASPAAPEPAPWVNRVWRVAESTQVQVGSLRVFLADGTLVMADPHGTAALGSWAQDPGGVTITEEGLTYPVEILAASEDELRIRIHGPGEAIEIRFEPADDWLVLAASSAEEPPLERMTAVIHHLELEGGLWVLQAGDGTRFDPTNLPAAFQVEGLPVEADVRRKDDVMSIGMVGPIVELVRIRRAFGEPASGGADALWGTSWRLENLAGAAVLAGAAATLEFPEAGRVAGNASCNRFFGSLEVAGDTLSFGAIGTTRRACAEEVNEQERRFLAALEAAERFEIDGGQLLLYSAGLERPLRFARE